ncbi:MAG: sigma-70 family RNA polymerase sigma factor [Planctomycetota bacterium]
MKTSKSLLIRAKDDPESEAWFRLVRIYDPLIAGWLRQGGVCDSDVADVTQDVLIAVVKGLSTFDHNGRTGAFRSWLKMIAINRCRRYRASRSRGVPAESDSILDQLEDPRSDLSRQWDAEHDRHVLKTIFQLISVEFDNRTIEAFQRFVFKNESAAEIAADFNVSRGQIYKFKFRVMKRLHEEARGLLDDAQGKDDSAEYRQDETQLPTSQESDDDSNSLIESR